MAKSTYDPLKVPLKFDQATKDRLEKYALDKRFGMHGRSEAAMHLLDIALKAEGY